MTKNIILRRTVVLASVAMVLSGCAKEQESPKVSSEGIIKFVTSLSGTEGEVNDGTTPTKAVSSFVDENGEETVLSLVEEVCNMPDPMTDEGSVSSESQSTKATLIDDADDFKENYDDFWVSAFKEGSPYSDISKLVVDKPTSGDVWTFHDGTKRNWPGSKVEYFAWAPASTTYSGGQAWSADPTFAPGQGSTATATISSYTVSDPVTQADILLGYYYGSAAAGEGTVDLKFSHPLVAVEFDVASDVQGDASFTGYKINYIEIKGAAKTASCTATLNTDPATFSWNVSSSFNWKHTFYDGGVSFEKFKAKLGSMLFIPQTFGTGAKLCLNISGGNDETYTIYYNLEGTSWTAGKVHKYSVTFKGTPALTVEDKIEDNIKKDLLITNTGDCKAWFRVAIVGYWCDKTKSNQNASAWINTSGTFVGLPAANWEKGDDVFWYYLNPVPAGEALPALFTSYTPPTAPGENLYLKMHIVSQCIKYDTDKVLVTKAWGNNTPITK